MVPCEVSNVRAVKGDTTDASAYMYMMADASDTCSIFQSSGAEKNINAVTRIARVAKFPRHLHQAGRTTSASLPNLGTEIYQLQGDNYTPRQPSARANLDIQFGCASLRT